MGMKELATAWANDKDNTLHREIATNPEAVFIKFNLSDVERAQIKGAIKSGGDVSGRLNTMLGRFGGGMLPSS